MPLMWKIRRLWNTPGGRIILLKYGLIALIVGIVGFFILTTIVFAVFSVDLPDPNQVVRREGFSTIIYDRNGKVLYDLYDKQHRIPLDLKDIPKDLQHATIAIEDKDFYRHQGIDPVGYLRSVRNVIVYRDLTGGSTLTQQLVKNVLLSSERSLTRKIKEAILASEIEKKFTKDQILQMYLNESPYGGATYGVESAAETYFGKSAKDLTLVESAILSGFPQLPTTYSPFGEHPKAYIARTTDVLRRMQEDGYITKPQEVDAVKQLPNVVFANATTGINAPHFVFYVKQQLVDKFGSEVVENGGLRVYTSLDLDLQEKAEQIVNEEVLKIKKLKVGNGAAVVLDPTTGEILSMVGSYDYFAKDYDGQVNVTTSPRQPGSAGKPFIYAAAFEKNYTPSSVLMDVKTEFPSGNPLHPIYIPENYDGKYRGLVQVRYALGNSLNIPAVKMTGLVGVKDVMSLGYNAGLTTWEPTDQNLKNVGLSLALGGREVKLLDLTSAYGTLANAGQHIEPVAILKVTDSKGKKLFEVGLPKAKKVLSAESAYLTSSILADDGARKEVFGQGSQLVISGKTVAVKTGTTDQKRDNWTVGYTKTRAIGVWVGNNDNSVMNPTVTSGVTGASPIWNKITKEALKDKSNEPFDMLQKVLSVKIDAFGGGLPRGTDVTRDEFFIKGTEPTSESQIYRRFRVSKANGKLANALEIKLGDHEDRDFVYIREDDPVSSDGKNRWQEGIDVWVNSNYKDDAKYRPPTEMSDQYNNSVLIRWDLPRDHDRVDTNDVHIRANAFSAREIVRFRLIIDGDEKANRASDVLDETIFLTNGSHKIRYEASDSAGNNASSEITIGVNSSWDTPAATSSAMVVRNFATVSL